MRNGVYPKSIETADSQYELLVRFNNDQDQLRGQALVDQYLSENRLDYLASLNRASTAPAWLRDIGGKPMSLGLDLSGGVHFLLQVDMDQYLDGVVADAAEAMRDMLIKERIRFIPGRNWVEDGAIVIKFRDESDKDSALGALDEFLDFDVFDREVGGSPSLRYTLKTDRVTELEDRAISIKPDQFTKSRKRIRCIGASGAKIRQNSDSCRFARTARQCKGQTNTQ